MSLFFDGNAQESVESRSIIGVWQETPVVASGWSTTYHFALDGSCAYLTNQMDCEDSLIAYYGIYKLKKKKIILKFSEVVYIGGAKLVSSDGSCATDFQLEGGSEMKKEIKKKEKFAYKFLAPDEDYDYLERAMFDGFVWYRMLHDPADFDY